jgi:hypothetical protein
MFQIANMIEECNFLLPGAGLIMNTQWNWGHYWPVPVVPPQDDECGAVGAITGGGNPSTRSAALSTWPVLEPRQPRWEAGD